MQGENTGSDSEEPVAANVDNKLEMLIKMINEIMIEVKELRKDKKIYITEIKEVKEENAKLREVNKMKTKIEWLETIEDRLEKTDKAKRKNNIIISGLKIETNDDSKMEEKINEFILQKLEINTKKKLRSGPNSYVWINNDLTENERKIQNIIREQAKEERSKNRNCKVIMGYQKMIVDGKKWNWDNKTKKLKIEDQRPKNLNG
ncbi:hypothetical protein QE152_g36479 [Popillia japonica]|uniref:Uncharacterized protein n=1 Tax=Popillia japonica TaxID=7064 RepID=A0AAW1ICS5_POPJA